MSVTGGNSVGIPLLLLHDAQGAEITIELKDGCTYQGLLEECQDNMNCTMKNVTRTDLDGNTTSLSMAYVRGNMILFFSIPEMLKHAPFFNRIKLWRKHRGKFQLGGGDAWMREKLTAGRQGGGAAPYGAGGRGGGGGGYMQGPPRQAFGGRGGGPPQGYNQPHMYGGGGRGGGGGGGSGHQGPSGGYGGPPPLQPGSSYGGGPPLAPGPAPAGHIGGPPHMHMHMHVGAGFARGALPGMGMVPMPRGPPPGPGGMMPRGFTGPPPGYGHGPQR